MSNYKKALVSVIIPVRNEQSHIALCLEAIRSQDYPQEFIEVLCVDGISSDKTRDIIKSYVEKYSNIQLLDNLAGIVPTAMNIGIRASQGDVIIRVDARCIIATDYISQCLSHLNRTGAWNVGGKQQTNGQETLTSELVALATTSPFGVGGSKFHYSDQAQYVDTVYLGAYPRWVLDKVGLYDETLLRNQDYELNHRIIAAGGKIFFTPEIRSTYYGRTTLAKLWRQYFQYGFWKVQTLQKHPGSAKLRHFIAPIFVASLIVSSASSIFRYGRVLLATLVFAYSTTTIVASLQTTKRMVNLHFAILPFIFAILHLSWGLGFCWRLLTLFLPPDRVPGSGLKR